MECLLLRSLHLPPPSTPPMEAAVPSTCSPQLLRALHVAPCHQALPKSFPIELVELVANSGLLCVATESCSCGASIVILVFVFQGQFVKESATQGLTCSWLCPVISGLTSFLVFPNYLHRWETQQRKIAFCKKGRRSCFALAPGLADGKSLPKVLPKGRCSGMAFPISDQLTGSRPSSPSLMYQTTLCTSWGRYLHASFLCRLQHAIRGTVPM